jgi:hypothetical protein
MPYTLTIQNIETDSNGVRVTATAANVELVN